MDQGALDMAALGRAIVRRRENLGWNTHALAVRSGLTDSYIRSLERGTGKRVGVEVVVRLARTLGISTDDLLRDAGLITGEALAPEVGDIYRQLTTAERHAWIQIGRALLTLQHEEEALQRASNEAERVTILTGETLERQRRPRMK
jgi:transcriptional regulator with XRE-family HTH domain